MARIEDNTSFKKTMPKKKRKKKKNKLIIVLCEIIALLIVAGALVVLVSPLKLNGDDEMSVAIGEKFKDPGTSSLFVKTEGEVDTSKVGDYVIVYKKGSKKVERKVHVVDPNNLVLGLKGSRHTLVKEGEPYIESGAFCIDKTAGAMADSEINIKGKVDTSKPGKYKVKYSVNISNIKKELVREVEVVSKADFKANTDGVAVLMYHYIYKEPNKPGQFAGNYTLDKDFEKQLKYLNENGYYYPSFKELRAYVDGRISLPEKSVVLTFDDGQEGFLSIGIPILEKYKVPATSFLIGTKGAADKLKAYASPYVQYQSHSYDMHKAGGNIGHGGVISAMSTSEIEADLKKIANILKNNEAFAYPYGDVTDDSKQAVKKAGIDCAFTTEFGKVHKGDNPAALSRVRVNGGVSLSVYAGNL